MTELSPEAKKLMELAREEFSPAEQRVTAVRSALELRIHLARGGGGGAAGGAPGFAGWSASHVIGIAALAIGLGTGLTLWLNHAAPSGGKAKSAPTPAALSAVPASPATPSVVQAARAAAEEPPLPASTARAPELRPPPARAQVAATGFESGEPRGQATPPSARSPKTPAVATARARRVSPSSPGSSSSHVAVTVRADANGPAPVPAPEPAQARQEPRSPAAATAATSEAPAEAVRPRADDSLAREMAVLRNARAALDRGDAQAALAIASQHAASFPNGTMRQEQLATRALALCALKRRAEAIAVKHELERIAPRSPHLMQIRSSCAQEDVR